jgi:hypothetical protein
MIKMYRAGGLCLTYRASEEASEKGVEAKMKFWKGNLTAKGAKNAKGAF